VVLYLSSKLIFTRYQFFAQYRKQFHSPEDINPPSEREDRMRREVIPVFTFLSLGLLWFTGCSSYQQGLIQAQRSQYPAAIEHFEKALQSDPGHLEARRQLGYAYLKNGQHAEAIEQFRQVMTRKPDDPFSTYYLGMSYLEDGQRGKTVETWRTYHNPGQPFFESELSRQATVVEIYDSIQLAHQALSQEQMLKTQPPQPNLIAVFSYQDTSPDSRFKHLERAVATLIITDLSQIKSIKVVERLKIQHLLRETQLGESGIVEAGTAPRAGRLLGAENLITGTMGPDSMQAKTSLASTSKRAVVSAFSVSTEPNKFYTLEKEIVYNIVNLLKVPLTVEEKSKINAYHTKDLVAVTFFGQGLEAMDIGKWDEARQFFTKAVAEDPGFELAKRYRDSCPSSTTASLAALSEMTNAQLTGMVVTNMSEASTASVTATGAGPPDGGAPAAAPGPSTGGVAVSW
jgi:tetratricopeptide (TPR) repeat protein